MLPSLGALALQAKRPTKRRSAAAQTVGRMICRGEEGADRARIEPELRAVQGRRDTEVSIAGSGILSRIAATTVATRGRTRERPREARVTPRPDPRSAALREAALQRRTPTWGARAGVKRALRPGVAHLKDDRGGARACRTDGGRAVGGRGASAGGPPRRAVRPRHDLAGRLLAEGYVSRAACQTSPAAPGETRAAR